jgi:hypothetical protein
MTDNILTYNITTSLDTKKVAYTFRDSIVRADKFMFRRLLKDAKASWEYLTSPRTSGDAPFSSLEDEADWTFAVVARLIVPRQYDVDFLLAIWDKEPYREARMQVGGSALTRSCARNFLGRNRPTGRQREHQGRLT